MMRFATPIAVMGALALGGCTTFGGGALPPGTDMTQAQIAQAVTIACGVIPSGPQIAAALNANAKTQAQVLAITTVGAIVCAYLGYGQNSVVVPAKASG